MPSRVFALTENVEFHFFQELLDWYHFVAMKSLDELAMMLAEQIDTSDIVVHGNNQRIYKGEKAKISAVENTEETLSEITLNHITLSYCHEMDQKLRSTFSRC
jgi:hypothetical protein